MVNAKQGFRHVSVGRETGQVWALSGAGIVCRRIGITDENPAGTGWVTGIGVIITTLLYLCNFSGATLNIPKNFLLQILTIISF